DWIVMKALEKDRNRRYETASAFADDVQRYLQDEEVAACPPSPLYRLGKLVRRNKKSAVAMTLVGLSFLGLCIGLIFHHEAIAAEAETKAAIAETKAANAKAEEDIARSKAEAARRQLLMQQMVHLLLTPHSTAWSRRVMDLVRQVASIKKDPNLRDRAAAS